MTESEESQPPYTHLEDFSEDIIAKAQDGLRVTNRELAEQAGIDLAEVKALKAGEPSAEEALRRAAPVLGLDPDRLVAAARGEWLPKPQTVAGLTLFTSRFHSMIVNAYLVEAPDGTSVLFDTGVDPDPILARLDRERTGLSAILLTHGHPDHVAALGAILAAHPDTPVHAHPDEGVAEARPFAWGQTVRAGAFALRCLETPGHTPGGTSFLFEGREPPLCIVGDALFAGSVGGCAGDYERSLRCVREHLLQLPPETVLCPGHGPVTTVAEERAHNPFFPEA